MYTKWTTHIRQMHNKIVKKKKMHENFAAYKESSVQ